MNSTFNEDYDRLNPNNIIDLRNDTNHPLSLLYSEIFSNAILEAKVEHGRSQPGFSLRGFSPFYLAAKCGYEYGLDRKDLIEVVYSVFKEYYKRVRPANAADWLDLGFDKDHSLQKMPPWASVFPWRARSVESYKQAYEKAAIEENKSVGMEGKDIHDGWLFCGPVTEEKIKIEAVRIANVLKSINKHGYQRSNEKDGDARATALVNEEGEWRWLLTAGNHRASAASALGFKAIPLRVNLVICRSQVNYWPHVVNGLYTKKQALQFFDRIFTGGYPLVANPWVEYIENKL